MSYLDVSPDTDEQRSKKYFSPNERLKIAQEAAVQKCKAKRQKQTWLSSTSNMALSTRTPSVQSHRRVPCNSSTRPSKEIYQHHHLTTREQAAWFLSLPDKVRRQQFSKEEQKLLSEEGQKFLNEQRPSLIYRGSSAQSQDDIASLAGASDSAHTTHNRLAAAENRARITSDTVAAEMDILRLCSKIRQSMAGPVADVDTRGETPPTAPARPAEPGVRLKQKNGNHTFFLTPITLPPPTLAPPTARPRRQSTFFISPTLSRRHINPGFTVSPPPQPAAEVGPIFELPCDEENIPLHLRTAGPTLQAEAAKSSLWEAMSPAPMLQRTPSAGDSVSFSSDGPSTPTLASAPPLSDHLKSPSTGFGAEAVLPMHHSDAVGGSGRSSSTLSHNSSSVHLAPSSRSRSFLVDDSLQKPCLLDPLALAPMKFCADSVDERTRFRHASADADDVARQHRGGFGRRLRTRMHL